MQKNIQKILHFLPIFLVVVLSIFIATSSYKPGTFLSGWDTLHPEFNLKLYTNRVIWGAWQEHQGLGAAAAQAHLAELPRLPIVWLLIQLFDISQVRYVFILGMYVLGGISTYWYLRYVWFRNKKYYRYSIASALGSLLYLCNLGTLQQFHVPLEMFAVHFATFGLVLGSFHLFITDGKKKFAMLLCVAQILATPSAHTATLFYVYTGILFGYGFLLAFLDKKHRKLYFQRFLLSCIIVFAANIYWMGPNIYYIFNNSHEIQAAKINRNFSEEAFWQNQAFGEINNVLTFKNFLFNWKIYDYPTNEFKEMFGSWTQHLQKFTLVWPFFLGAIFLSGIISSFGKKRKEKLPLIIIFILGFLFLNNLNQPSIGIYKFVISLSNTLKEALRFPFTKFSIIFIFAASVYFAEFSKFIFEKIAKIKQENIRVITTILISLTFAFSVLYPMKPLLEGKLLSDAVKVTIPTEYFELFDWFENQPKTGKIALFPMIDFWPWTYYDWSTETQKSGYQGGGFLWFGLKQPLLNREFDRWSPQNEDFFHEMNAAIQNKNEKQFKEVIEKYDVKWLVYDKNIFDPQGAGEKTHTITNTEIQKRTFEEFIAKNNTITVAKNFGNITVYAVEQSKPTSVQEVSSLQKKVLVDTAYEQKGDYIIHHNFDTNFIFSNIYTENLNSLVFKTEDSLEIRNQVNGSEKLSLPSWQKTKSYLPVALYATGNGKKISLKVVSLLPTIGTQESTYQLSDFADTAVIVTQEEFSFEDDFYLITTEKSSEIFDPNNPEEQRIGTAFIQFGENLEITVSASYNQKIQKIYVPNRTLASLFPKEKEITLNQKSDLVSIAYTDELLSLLLKEIAPSQTYFEQNCAKQGTVAFTDVEDSRLLSAQHGGIACQGFILNNLPKGDGYLLNFHLKNISGPNVYVQSNEMGKTKIFFQETPNNKMEINSFGLFPENNNDLSFVVVNRSFGSFTAQNRIDGLNLLPIPFEYFSKFIAHNKVENSTERKVLTSLKPQSNDFYSLVKTNKTDSGIVVLEQSYDSGWTALSLENPFKKIQHFQYNSWANAWQINQNDNFIIIFFLPQMIVWVGLLLLFITLIFLTRYNPKYKKMNAFTFKKIRSIFYDK